MQGAAAGLHAGVAVHPLSRHRSRPGPAGLVIGYAATTPDRITEAIRLVAGLAPRAARSGVTSLPRVARSPR